MSYDFYFFLGLLTCGYVFGRIAEKSHFKSIIKREKQLKRILAFNIKTIPPDLPATGYQLVGGNVVISIDYFKKIAAGLRGLIGGRMTAYESLLERARREAILRMKEEARMKGAQYIFNVRLETASIAKGKKNQIGSVEVYAYGTAVISK